MKHLLFFVILTISMHTSARVLEKWYPNCVIKSTERDSSISINEAKFTFEFSPLDGSSGIVQYSIDGISLTQQLDGHMFDVMTTPGKHIFQFYYSENYYEVYTDSLEIQGGFHSTYSIFMERADMRLEVDKPVIYLYPEKEIAVELKLNIVGTPTFYYPAYFDSWKFTALPSGELRFGENVYNYLFWESSQNRSFSASEMTTGFSVQGTEVITFLEEKLTTMGFNSKEKADFITFWGPRLAKNDHNFVRFEFDEECDRYATIEVTPTPENINRVYIAWMAVDQQLEVEEQIIVQLNRTGFSVLEWGGFEVKNILPRSSKAVK